MSNCLNCNKPVPPISFLGKTVTEYVCESCEAISLEASKSEAKKDIKLARNSEVMNKLLFAPSEIRQKLLKAEVCENVTKLQNWLSTDAWVAIIVGSTGTGKTHTCAKFLYEEYISYFNTPELSELKNLEMKKINTRGFHISQVPDLEPILTITCVEIINNVQECYSTGQSSNKVKNL